MQKVVIIIPAYNEEQRIGVTLQTYLDYFCHNQSYTISYIIVLNGCTDNTYAVVKKVASVHENVQIVQELQAGKGRAVKIGFLQALQEDVLLIGFLDADMATRPAQYEELLQHIGTYDGIIASRYMEESQTIPPRPFIKKWGRVIFYNTLIKLLFSLWYRDLQCGAKIFRRHVIAVVAPQLTDMQWSFDVELLYLCKRYGFCIKEFPTLWYDQAGSKLRLFRSGLRMLGSLIHLRFIYSPFRKWFIKKGTE